jgi:hypothetical protein
MIPAKPIFLQVGGRLYPVASFEQASKMFCTARDIPGQGASNTIVNGAGSVVGRRSGGPLCHRYFTVEENRF